MEIGFGPVTEANKLPLCSILATVKSLMPEVLDSEIYGNAITAWGLAAILTAAILAVALVARVFLLRRLPESGPGEPNWRSLLRDLIERISILFIVIASLYIGTSLLKLPAWFHSLVFSVFVIALFIQCALWADRIVSAVIAWRLAPRRVKAPMRNALTVIEVLVRVGIWSVALLLIFENLGFDVTALVAGLGIGGIAVALAAQRVLGDLFSSLAIVLDRPFEVGDVIVFGDQTGTVERIGIKTTRLRSIWGEQIICSNSDLIESRIHNFKRMAERRVVLSLAVTYDTPTKTLERIPALLQDIIERQESTRFERAHFQRLGDSALLFEIVYWVLSPDYRVYMDIQQAVNLEILGAFDREGIAFAEPTKTVLVLESKEKLGVTGTARPARLRATTGRQ